MSLTQTQIIQSLAEGLAWFEKELGWGVSPGELNHLTGRIGELYAAMITRGQMALETNQRGYDVISAENERISVKTVTSSNHVSFNPSTFDQVDRVIVLRVNIDEEDGVSVEILLDCSSVDFLENHGQIKNNGKYVFALSTNTRPKKSLENLQVSNEAQWKSYSIRQFENGTIQVLIEGSVQQVAKPHLRAIAAQIGIDLLNSNSGTKNTRQLGADLIKMIRAKAEKQL
ncbi:DUF6998 domain-containing protein [Yoonia sp. 2307UL14-13]|uniref:DUF6998 domain-containing protein n=1 Tax=Yoonia sp. 2307UL14-13 TaxID=3126506 RepID=UPI0030A161B2